MAASIVPTPWPLLFSQEVSADAPVGGKAGALGQLVASGLPVPAWFVVLPSALEQSLDPEEKRRIANAELDALDELFAGVRPSAAIRAAIDEALARLAPNEGELFAVRSSAADEDSAEHSFAGQLESYLFVEARDVPERIADVWRSGFSKRLLAYRQQAGLEGLPPVPAVIVQRCIDGEVSGVAFSADPVSHQRDRVLVSAVWGLGAGLVSGEMDADTWRVDEDEIADRQLVEARSRCHRDLRAPEGYRIEPLEGVEDRPPLDDRRIRAVADLARAAERFFGRPQDVEWTVDRNGELYLLQSRPITTLHRTQPTGGRRRIWDNTNIVESYSGVTTPFTFSFARRAYQGVYEEFWRLMKVPKQLFETHGDLHAALIGLVNGRVYYNMVNCYRLLSALPGFRLNREYTERMLGFREEMPPEIVAEIESASTSDRVIDAFRLTRTLGAGVRHHLELEKRVERFLARVERALAPGTVGLEEMDADELVAHYRELEAKLLHAWDAPVLNDLFLSIFDGELGRVCEQWMGDDNGQLHNDLLCGEGRMISRELADRVLAMAKIAASNEAMVKSLLDEEAEAIQRRMHVHPALERAYASYMAELGDRCVDELKLESPTLHDNPLPLLRAIGACARRVREHGTPERQEAAIRARAEARADAALRRHPLRRRVFRWLLDNARAGVRQRENLRFQRTRVFGLGRRIVVEMGKRLRDAGLLDDHRDIFYLTVEEMMAMVDGTAVTTDLRPLVEVRRREFEGHRRAPKPKTRFETRGIVYGDIPAEEFDAETIDGDVLQGIGSCPGTVRGRARVVTDPSTACLGAQEILVAECTDPGWVMIFPGAAGLLVERGSLLSHSAIVAREIGLPTVVSIAGLTAWVRDGEWIEMNGGTGVVRRIAEPEGDSDAAA